MHELLPLGHIQSDVVLVGTSIVANVTFFVADIVADFQILNAFSSAIRSITLSRWVQFSLADIISA